MSISFEVPSYSLPIAERQKIQQSVFLAPLNTAVKLLIAEKVDEEVLLSYICDQFSRNEPIDVSTGKQIDLFQLISKALFYRNHIR
jgi:hypothetical protein